MGGVIFLADGLTNAIDKASPLPRSQVSSSISFKFYLHVFPDEKLNKLQEIIKSQAGSTIPTSDKSTLSSFR